MAEGMDVDNSLLDSPFADTDIEAPQRRVIEQPWKKWTDGDKKKISEYMKYHTDSITYFTERWARGPSDTPPPKDPPYDIKELVMKRKVKARATPMSSDSGKSGKTKKISVSTMTANEMNAYLQSLECVDVAGEIADIMPTSDIMEMANYLKQTYQRINKTESQLLKSYVDFGNNLKLAQERFRLEKRMTKFSQKWGEWIMINANISPSYARKIMQMAELAGKYPRLQKLAVTFKQLYQMRNKIAEIFAKNEHISQQWK